MVPQLRRHLSFPSVKICARHAVAHLAFGGLHEPDDVIRMWDKAEGEGCRNGLDRPVVCCRGHSESFGRGGIPCRTLLIKSCSRVISDIDRLRALHALFILGPGQIAEGCITRA